MTERSFIVTFSLFLGYVLELKWVIVGIMQNDLETVIPSIIPSQARIVGPAKSKRKGQVVQVLQKNVDGKDEALIQFEDDPNLHKWSYDHLCAIR